jgi:4'-phosphopantetheinyl transferase
MHKSNIEQANIFPGSAIFREAEFGDIEIELRWSHVEDFSKTDLSRFEDLLTAEELDRVRAAKTEMVQKTRLVARALLKAELALRTGIPARRLPLQLSPFGKPSLSSSSNWPVKFSLSYSQGWIVHAFSDRLEIGVDLECINPNHMTWQLVQDMLTKDEQVIVAGLSEAKRATKFFELWTAKESVLKAAGVGFNGLDDLTLHNRESFSCLGQSWKTSPLTAPAGFASAVAWAHHPSNMGQ